jgi:hypothetical protein
MFTGKITESDAFLEMPLSTQALYFHLCMNADDDGFVKNPKRISKMIGGNDDDLKLLMAKRFVIYYDATGVIVIKHWRMHNLLRKDRYKETEYTEEKSMLYLKENGAYTLDETQGIPLIDGMATKWQPNGNQMAPQESKGKDRIGKVNTPPLPPSGGETSEWNFDKHTNVENTKHFLNGGGYAEAKMLLENPELWTAVKDWMAYKDDRKPRSSNHYVNEKSLVNFLNKVVRYARQCGVETVVEVISDTIGAGYQGVVWDWCYKKRSSDDELEEWANDKK